MGLILMEDIEICHMLVNWSRQLLEATGEPCYCPLESFVNKALGMLPLSFARACASGDFMAKRIYVGNLPYSATAEDLQASFAEHGEVLSTRIITDRETGRSKGFAFVEMTDENAAQSAIDALNGAEYLGRILTVNEARPREEGMGGGGGGGRGFGGGGGGHRGGPRGGGGFGGGRDSGPRGR
jgi:uncharacterized membrane protein YgcG